jgi:hypothetical protein
MIQFMGRTVRRYGLCPALLLLVLAAGAEACWAQSYTTNFPGTENPISEGGHWINGGTTGIDWGNVSTTPGYAVGHSGAARFADATALLTGTWGPDQTAQATVRAGAVSGAPEVELRLRSTLSAHSATGYEISESVAGGGNGSYLIIVRWNGPLADFTYLANLSGPQYSVTTGDVVKATIVGNVITAYKNGVQIGQATDNTYTSGNPGMGFNEGSNGDYGFTTFSAVGSAPPPPPTLTSFAPASGPAGASVTLTGTNFTGATAVKFNGLAATFSVVSATSITATVPAGATSGKIAVTTPGGTATSSASFTVTMPPPLPTLTSFEPTSGPAGTSVTLTGTNFTGATAVKFNGLAATFSVVSATSITATVPAGATSGKIAVTTPGGTATSSASFTVTTPPPPPTLTSFVPTSGPVGTGVTITGTNFSGATAVKFNGSAAATFTVVSATSITATVPAGATTGKIAVTTPGGAATSAANYTVTLTGTLPAPWLDTDVGSPGIAGSAGSAGGTFTVNGSGLGFIGTSDHFNFAYQPLSGDGQIIARVTGLGTTAGELAGVMIRESLAGDSSFALTALVAGSGAAFLSRSSTGGTVTTTSGPPATPPYFMRLVRSGNTFTSFASADGVTWTQIGATVTIPMSTNVFIGFAVTSGSNAFTTPGMMDSLSGSGGWSAGAGTPPPATSGGGHGGCGLIGLEGFLLILVTAMRRKHLDE